MAGIAYPRREGFFAGKFCRLMTKVALANTLGTDVVCLLMVIAHQEDAAGYRSAVTWWNDQLKPLIGVKTDHALIRTRNKAIHAGWLHYEAGGKGVAGRYWVTVPREFQDLDSAPTADAAGEYGGIYPVASDMTNGFSTGASDRRSGGEVTGEAEGKPATPGAGARESGGKVTGIATTILPLPIPIPREEPPNPPPAGGGSQPTKAVRKPQAQPQHPENVPLPASLDTPDFRPVWADWLTDRKARRKPVSELAARQQLAALVALGPNRAAECVRESIRNGWTGLFPEKFSATTRQRSPPSARGAAETQYATDQALNMFADLDLDSEHGG